MWRNLNVAFADHGSEQGSEHPCPIFVRTPPRRWNYASLSSEAEISAAGRFALVKVSATVQEGPLGIGLVSSRDISCYIVPERILARSPATQEATFLVATKTRFRVCIRTGEADRSALARITNVTWTDAPNLVKDARSAKFPHWYYTTDLGDGVLVRASVEDEPGWTRANAVARSIFSYLIKEHVGPISGSKVLDVACSAGHFSFLFAQMGAIVDGFDHDTAAIEQAGFIADQLQESWIGSTRFMVADLENFSTAEQYDLVFCSGLFYHLRDPIGGAQRLARLTRRWALLQSCVCNREEPVFELSDPARWPFCADWELCLVPSASMVQALFEKLGLHIRASFRLSDFVVDDETISVKPGPAQNKPERIARLGDPVYLVMEKAD
ncbi:MAG: class I SAM-dependent methyltransferase [Hyphomicrobiales bacterium]|nr:class I SAM-dependent methyltransferase [Hyphomicrobiales bacterium]MBV8768570.1 class I SAM-dependent methyltransferase [Hyphomicrobiales bacterium]MBV9976391.1 class I SAM-dependent methyltransferase [Hyphomicrobiales bacterium]